MKAFLQKLFNSQVQQEKQSLDGKFKPISSEQYKKYNQFRPEGAKQLFCYVPFTNMTFSFRGRVLACAYNQKVELGKYPDQSVKEMWFNSDRGNQLREHMEHNDLSYGCKHCKYFFDNSKFSGLKPLVFDKYSDYKKHKYPRVLEFELSNTCNFECVMCNGEVSSSIRKNKDKLPPIKSPYDDEFVEQLKEFIPHIKEAKFYGGEPFLIDIYYKIWDLIIELNPKVRIFVITNGSVLNSRIKALLSRGNFDIGVSMDSMNKEVLESIRLNVKQERLLENVSFYQEYLKANKNNLTVSFTMMRLNWQEFTGVIEFCNERKIQLYVSYLKTPPQFALWNLPADKLKEIRESLETKQFPKGNYVEKNNAKCFEDFLTYLSNCEAKNRRNPIKPKQQNKVVNEAKKKVEPAIKTSISEYDQSLNYKEISFKKLEEYIALNNIDDQSKKNFYTKLQNGINALPESSDLNKLYFMISKTAPAVLIKDVDEMDLETLKESMLKHV